MEQSSASGPPVGIDLGTTFSVVATLDAQGRPRTIQNAEGDVTTPSVVMFDRDSVVVGKEAVKLASFEPEAIAAYAKRDIGATRFGKAIRGHHLPPEVVQSFVLRKLKADAELKIGPIRQAVITVPAYFNEPRRKATQDAGRLAGLEILDIINEPTAAALAYGVERGLLSGDGEVAAAETVLVYDLGGGTFDVTLMRLEGHDYTALATAGDVYLGGIDWDQRIVNYLATQFVAKHNLDPRENPSALVRLLREAEDAKRALTAREDVIITFENEGHKLRTPLTRADFEQMSSALLERTRFTIRNVLREAKLQWKDVTRLLLVGGSSRMPQVQAMLRQESGLEPDRSLAADEAVAHGAAVYAGYLLAGRDKAVHFASIGNITNVSSHDLGVLGTEVATGRPRRRLIIRHNTKLPITKGGRFHTQQDDQRSVLVRVVEGGDDSGLNATIIGTCAVTELPPGLPAHTPIDVIFKYKENGRLVVHARLPKQDCQATTEIKRDSGLSEAELQDWEQRIAEGRLLPETAEPVEDVEPEMLTEAIIDDGVVDEPSPIEAFDFLLGDEESESAAIHIVNEPPPVAHGLDDPDLDDFFRNLK